LHLVRRAFGVMLVVVIALTASPGALAHARLVVVKPANGAIVATAPDAVRLFFDEPVAVAPGNAVVAADRRSVLGGPPRLERGGRLLVLPLARVRSGDYSVSWRVLSDDGHLEAGVLAFRVGTGGAGAPTPVLAAASTRPGTMDVLSRWLFLGGILLAGGTALFTLLVSRAGTRPASVTMAAALVGGALGGAWLVHATGGATRFTHVTEFAVLVAVAGAIFASVAAAGARRAPFVVALSLSLALLLAPTLAGHAFRAWDGRPLSVAADLVHVFAAAFWTGGLLQLLLLVRAGGDERVVRRFSLFALPAVALIAASGLARALVELTAVSQLWTTGYGRALVIKSLLLCVLVALGWMSRRALADPGRLRRSVVAELTVLVLLVGVVGVLTALGPGRDALPAAAGSTVREIAPAPAPPAGAVVFAAQAQELAVGLAVRPGSPLRLIATVIGQTGNGVDGLDVRLSGASGSVARSASGRPCGHGCYEAEVTLAAPTRFGVVIAGSGPLRTLRFPVRLWPPPSGAAFLRRATRSFGDQQSVVYSEHLASDPEHAITTTWKLEAPGSVAYSIAEGGAQGIVIGVRRWDRASPDAPWKRSASERLVQPAPPWGSRQRDVHVVRESDAAITLAWVDPVIPAWYSATFMRTTALPTTLQMTAPAHFMVHRYLVYDGPLQIRPPR
jgi:copper transport protein